MIEMTPHEIQNAITSENQTCYLGDVHSNQNVSIKPVSDDPHVPTNFVPLNNKNLNRKLSIGIKERYKELTLRFNNSVKSGPLYHDKWESGGIEMVDFSKNNTKNNTASSDPVSFSGPFIPLEGEDLDKMVDFSKNNTASSDPVSFSGRFIPLEDEDLNKQLKIDIRAASTRVRLKHQPARKELNAIKSTLGEAEKAWEKVSSMTTRTEKNKLYKAYRNAKRNYEKHKSIVEAASKHSDLLFDVRNNDISKEVYDDYKNAIEIARKTRLRATLNKHRASLAGTLRNPVRANQLKAMEKKALEAEQKVKKLLRSQEHSKLSRNLAQNLIYLESEKQHIVSLKPLNKNGLEKMDKISRNQKIIKTFQQEGGLDSISLEEAQALNKLFVIADNANRAAGGLQKIYNGTSAAASQASQTDNPILSAKDSKPTSKPTLNVNVEAFKKADDAVIAKIQELTETLNTPLGLSKKLLSILEQKKFQLSSLEEEGKNTPSVKEEETNDSVSALSEQKLLKNEINLLKKLLSDSKLNSMQQEERQNLTSLVQKEEKAYEELQWAEINLDAAKKLFNQNGKNQAEEKVAAAQEAFQKANQTMMEKIQLLFSPLPSSIPPPTLPTTITTVLTSEPIPISRTKPIVTIPSDADGTVLSSIPINNNNTIAHRL